MTEPRTAPDEPADETRELDAYEDDWPDEPADSLPPRPRRRLVTPLSAALAAVAVAALGFVAGVEVQKAQGGTTTGSGATSARAAFAGRAGGLPGQAGGGRAGRGGRPTFGTVASKSGRTLYVKDSNGTTVKVKLAGQAKVTRSAAASAKSIHPGDTVIVQGTRSSSGTVTAARVTATSSTAASAGGGPGALFGGGARGGGFPSG